MTEQAVESVRRRRLNPVTRFVRDDWFRFRVLTVTNTVNVIISAVAAIRASGGWATAPEFMDVVLFMFPFVWVTLKIPGLSIGVFVVAALIATIALYDIPRGERLRRYVRALTGVGAITLLIPFLFSGALLLPSLFSSIPH
jgi:hypothetical protein